MSDKIMYVTTPLRDEQIHEFRRIQAYLGIGNKADVVRHLIHKEARRIQEAAVPQRELARE